MADLDNRSKRASSVQILIPSTLAPVLPDGTIDQADRQHTAHTYSGILASSPGGVSLTVLDKAQFRRVFSFIFGRVN